MSENSGSNEKAKRAKFRELAKADRICVGSRFAEDFEQPFLPFDEFKLSGLPSVKCYTAPRGQTHTPLVARDGRIQRSGDRLEEINQRPDRRHSLPLAENASVSQSKNRRPGFTPVGGSSRGATLFRSRTVCHAPVKNSNGAGR